MLQEFDLWVLDRKGMENQVTDHPSRMETDAEEERDKVINDKFIYEHLF